MPEIEIYLDGEFEKHLLTAGFAMAPRKGETLSIMREDLFTYYRVVDVWHRQDKVGDPFTTCVAVRVDD